ncbi:MAG: N-acetylglucosamine-6-phosphate deacetylase [Devosiaceae bacterium]|nr:N-acetylglucosamine-6-phosphate deacetylase [Devosiaceae bacterium MH13]
MSQRSQTFVGGPIFDGQTLHHGWCARFEHGVLAALGPAPESWPADAVDLGGDILSIGYVDLQVNGGGGVMLNDDPSVATLQTIAEAHRSLGVARLLPTLITDTRETTRAAIAAAIEAVERGVTGIAGLHLEGPHLSARRKGAHDGALIRPMEADDLAALLDAAERLPCLMVTLAPESVRDDQVERLARAGVVVSLGHTDADYETCQRVFGAGATCATHLFNAMSPLGHRAPGLVGAALANGVASAGLIADGIHVHREVMRVAWRAKRGPGHIFLVSDAMAAAGTDLTAFTLGGREILRRDGQLRLADGTLAGADLDLTRAVSVLQEAAEIPLANALAAATSAPAAVCGLACYGLTVGATPLSDVISIRADLSGVTPL